jgi:hypothetical protein
MVEYESSSTDTNYEHYFLDDSIILGTVEPLYCVTFLVEIGDLGQST